MPPIHTITTKQLCLFALILTLFVIASVAWFCLAIPKLMENGSEACLILAFSGTSLWVVAGFSLVIYIVLPTRS